MAARDTQGCARVGRHRLTHAMLSAVGVTARHMARVYLAPMSGRLSHKADTRPECETA